MTKSLEIDVFSNTSSVESRIRNPTDSTVCIGAWHIGQVTYQPCAMIVFFHRLVLEILLVSTPPSLQSWVGDYVHEINLGTGAFSWIPVSCELLRNLRKFLLISLSNHGGITWLQTCKGEGGGGGKGTIVIASCV